MEKTPAINAVQVTYQEKAEIKEIRALIHKPELVFTSPTYQLFENTKQPGQFKLLIRFVRRKRWYSKYYHVLIENGIMLI